MVFGLRRRRRGYDAAAYDDDRALGMSSTVPLLMETGPPDEDFGLEHFGFATSSAELLLFGPAPDAGSTLRVSWPRGAGAAVGDAEHLPGEEGYGSDLLSGPSNVGVEGGRHRWWTPRRPCCVADGRLLKSVPISLVPERVVPRLRSASLCSGSNGAWKRCRLMSTLPIC